MESLQGDSVVIQFDKPDFDGAVRVAHREAKLRFLDLVEHNGFDLIFDGVKASYDYSLDQTIYYYHFTIALL